MQQQTLAFLLKIIQKVCFWNYFSFLQIQAAIVICKSHFLVLVHRFSISERCNLSNFSTTASWGLEIMQGQHTWCQTPIFRSQILGSKTFIVKVRLAWGHVFRGLTVYNNVSGGSFDDYLIRHIQDDGKLKTVPCLHQSNVVKLEILNFWKDIM